MADYRDLLRKAIDSLPDNTGSERRFIYDKARSALVSQLRATVPTLPAREITTRRLMLEDQIREVESEATERHLRQYRDIAAASIPNNDELIEAQSRFKREYATYLDLHEPETEDESLLLSEEYSGDEAASFTQRPAAFQFAPVDGKITASALGRVPSSDLGTDLHDELRKKARTLLDRLSRTQAPAHLSQTLATLLDELGNDFSDVRPGILLSRSRAIEASLAAYSEVDQREGLMPDAFSALSEFSASLDDFKALFPELLALESARLAQGLGLDDVDRARTYAAQIADMAGESNSVDPSAVEALRAPSIDIDATDRILAETTDTDKRRDAFESRAKIVAQQLLDIRNFSAAAVSAGRLQTAEYLGDAGRSIRDGSLEGLKHGTKGVVQSGFVALSVSLFGPIAGLAALAVTFRPLAERAERLKRDTETDAP